MAASGRRWGARLARGGTAAREGRGERGCGRRRRGWGAPGWGAKRRAGSRDGGRPRLPRGALTYAQLDGVGVVGPAQQQADEHHGDPVQHPPAPPPGAARARGRHLPAAATCPAPPPPPPPAGLAPGRAGGARSARGDGPGGGGRLRCGHCGRRGARSPSRSPEPARRAPDCSAGGGAGGGCEGGRGGGEGGGGGGRLRSAPDVPSPARPWRPRAGFLGARGPADARASRPGTSGAPRSVRPPPRLTRISGEPRRRGSGLLGGGGSGGGLGARATLRSAWRRDSGERERPPGRGHARGGEASVTRACPGPPAVGCPAQGRAAR